MQKRAPTVIRTPLVWIQSENLFRNFEKASQGAEPELDPAAVKRAAEEAEERRLAEIRAHGTPVTPDTFAPWKARFYADLKAARCWPRFGASFNASVSDCLTQEAVRLSMESSRAAVMKIRLQLFEPWKKAVLNQSRSPAA